MDPTVARESVPEQLELISKELLAPLQGIFHHLVQQVSDFPVPSVIYIRAFLVPILAGLYILE